jgi:HEAT repeat protein
VCRPYLFFAIAPALVLCACSRQLPYEGKSLADLKDMLASADPVVQAQGAYGLSLDSAKAREAVPELTDALASKDSNVREWSAKALGSVGPDASMAVPALIKALRDKSWPVQRQAAMALGKMGPRAWKALPALDELRESPDKLVRQAAEKARRLIDPPEQKDK